MALITNAGPARAGDRDELAVPRHSVGLTLAIMASEIGDLNAGGAGPSLELALGRKRLQYFAEASLGVAGVGHVQTSNVALSMRGGGGVRWLVRSFIADSAAIDLIFDVAADVESLQWNGGGRTWPTVGGGAGWQVRNLRTGFTIRVMTRIYVDPFLNAAPAMPVCRGTCPGDPTPGNFSFGGQFGVAW